MQLLSTANTRKEMTENQVKEDCLKDYLDFVGRSSMEDDGGWSYEVWREAQAALFKRMNQYVSQQEAA